MPITLVTGAPGHGKTQYAVDVANTRAAEESRQVFYCGIDGITVPGWAPFDPTLTTHHTDGDRYQGVPDGAILIIDEAWKIYPQRKGTEEAPPHERILSTHRHAGYDIYLVTQHPKDVPAYARRRVEEHRHLKRKLKKNIAICYVWSEGVLGEIEEGTVKNASKGTKEMYKYKPEVWAMYKSATINTVKSGKFHYKHLAFPVAIVFLLGVVWYVIDTFAGVGETYEQAQEKESALIPAVFKERGKEKSPLEWIEARLPRVEELPYSAPVYDAVNEPQSFPRLQCVQFGTTMREVKSKVAYIYSYPSGGVCKCFTQQGSHIDVDRQTCMQVVRYGYFDPAFADEGIEDPDDKKDGQLQPVTDGRSGLQYADNKNVNNRPSGPNINIVRSTGLEPQRIDIEKAQKRLDNSRELSPSNISTKGE